MEQLKRVLFFMKEHKEQIKFYGLISLIILSMALGSIAIYYSLNNEECITFDEVSKIIEEKVTKNEVSNESPIKTTITIDVKGAVKTPGVYTLEENSRVIDAINASGGLNKNANTKYINLSKVLTDSNVIIIYTNDEIKELEKEETKVICTPEKNLACTTKDEIVNESIKEDKDTSNLNNNSLININTATIEELMTLDGIGESKAKSIIEYRETNGLFNTIEDIKNVSGIGESAYDKIKENITIK